MSSNALAAGARQAWQILLWQVSWVVAIAAASAVALGARTGWSVLAGGGIGLISTVYMALTMLRHSIDHGRRLSAAKLFAAWLIRMVLTVSMLIIAFRSKALAPLPLLSGLSVALIAYWAWLTFRVKHADGDGANGK